MGCQRRGALLDLRPGAEADLERAETSSSSSSEVSSVVYSDSSDDSLRLGVFIREQSGYIPSRGEKERGF